METLFVNKNPYASQPFTILSVQQETESEFTFLIKSDLQLKCGQFVEVSIPGIGEAPISISGINQGSMELTIRGVGKLTNAILGKKPGETVWIRGPYGNSFPTELFENKPLVIAAGGSGIAPVRPLIRSRLNNSFGLANTSLIFGFKNPESLLFKEEISHWSNKVPLICTVDNPSSTWSGKSGLITQHVRELDLQDNKQTQVVIVGPPVMMKFTAAEFIARSVSRENIWVSFERRMACGLGKCGHCKIDSTYICLEGPIFRYDKAITLID